MSQDYLQSKDYSVGTILTDFRPFYIPIEGGVSEALGGCGRVFLEQNALQVSTGRCAKILFGGFGSLSGWPR